MGLRVEEAETTTAPAGFININARAAGICCSDLHNFRTGIYRVAA
jgi:(R,R)-butanediol dehydrogenase/meso-butanediol dehydrogenase/diacetyl reductase